MSICKFLRIFLYKKKSISAIKKYEGNVVVLIFIYYLASYVVSQNYQLGLDVTFLGGWDTPTSHHLCVHISMHSEITIHYSRV